MKNAVIFVDGNNLYHNLKIMRIRPGDIDFKKLAEFISKHFNCSIKEAIYYNSLPSLRDGKETYFRHLKFIDDLKKIPNFTVKTRKLQVHSTKELRKHTQDIIDSLDLCGTCKPLVEQNFLDVIGNAEKKEKGIDVMIAIDLVEYAIKKRADSLIIVSGDADFIPAMHLAKENKAEVYSAFLDRGYSRELREKFEFFVLGRDIIVKNCLK